MKKSVMPYVAKAISSDALLNAKRGLYEWRRKFTGQPREIVVFIAADDPYSFVLLQVLPEFIKRFNLEITLITIEEYQSDMFPDLDKWRNNALLDAQRLAELYQLKPPLDSGQLGTEYISQMTAKLLVAESQENPLRSLLLLLSEFWTSQPVESATTPAKNLEKLKRNQQRLKKAGHYLPAVIQYAGEWYWGIDRLAHLERRLSDSAEHDIKYDKQQLQLETRVPTSETDTPLEVYYSARSPYSYLGLEQAKVLCEHYRLPILIKPVLPMMMRGLKVPDTKKMAIFHDTKREAKVKGIPYGFVADPLGKAVEKGYAIYQCAIQQNKGLEFLIQFGRAVNSLGIRADREEGLKLIAEKAGLDWAEAKPFLECGDWRTMVADNMRELNGLGLWGVPCFRHGDTLVWGQDRLWVIERKLLGIGLTKR